MEEPGAERLRANNSRHAIRIQLREHSVVDRHGEMKHATKRLIGLPNFSEEPRDVRRRSRIGFHNLHFGAAIAQILNERFGLRRRRAVATREDQMTRTGLGKPVSQHLAETAECSRDEIASVRLDFEFRCDRLAASGQERFWKRDDNFSDVLAARHESKGRVDIEGRERTERKWTQGALFNEIGNLSEHFTRE